MNYRKLWNKLRVKIINDDTLNCSCTRVLELMDEFEHIRDESNEDKSSVPDDRFFEKSETGNYNPKPF